MGWKLRVSLVGMVLAMALLFSSACRDPLDLPAPDPQPVEPFR